ncbi:angiotensin-converting enzyme family protein, partial [Aphelenchoides avenae]
PEHSIKSPEEAKKWLMGYEKEAAKVLPQVATSAWNYFTTASPITRQYLDEAKEVVRMFLKATGTQAKQFDTADLEKTLALQIETISRQGINALETEELAKFSDLPGYLQHANDPVKLLHLWQSWREKSGEKLSKLYKELIEISDK